VQGFGAEFVKEYVQKTGFDGAFNVGEFWTDLKCALSSEPYFLHLTWAQSKAAAVRPYTLTPDSYLQLQNPRACCILLQSPCSWGSDGLEYDQNGPRQTLVDWIKGCDGVSTTFDFPTKGILQVSNLIKLSGLNGSVRSCSDLALR
jgi:hypothetical protein